jgi:hypothetical protein
MRCGFDSHLRYKKSDFGLAFLIRLPLLKSSAKNLISVEADNWLYLILNLSALAAVRPQFIQQIRQK